jgi:hypothetical protein
VLLLGAPPLGGTYNQESYRGQFRLLSEEHVPFAVSDNMDWLGKREFDLVVAADWAPAALKQYAEHGGRVLVASARKPDFEVAPVVGTINDLKGYARVRDREVFPSLKDADLVMINGPFTEIKGDGGAPLTLIPPSMIGPPEFVHVDMKEMDTPAIFTRALGKGMVTWIPWNLGALYYRHSLPAHAALFRDVMDRLNPRRQVRTDAHPLVEMTVMRQQGRTLLHLVNLSGHSQTGYYQPIPMIDINFRVDGAFHRASTVRTSRNLAVKVDKGYSAFKLPRLADYELVVLQ